MTDRRMFLTALVSWAVLGSRAARADTPASLTWARDAKDPRWVQGQVLIATPPDVVWERLQRVPEWPQMFTDIKTMRILERNAAHYRVRLETRTLDCGAHDYDIRLEAPRTAKLWIDAPGVTALAYMRVLNGTEEGSSRVVYSPVSRGPRHRRLVSHRKGSWRQAGEHGRPIPRGLGATFPRGT